MVWPFESSKKAGEMKVGSPTNRRQLKGAIYVHDKIGQRPAEDSSEPDPIQQQIDRLSVNIQTLTQELASTQDAFNQRNLALATKTTDKKKEDPQIKRLWKQKKDIETRIKHNEGKLSALQGLHAASAQLSRLQDELNARTQKLANTQTALQKAGASASAAASAEAKEDFARIEAEEGAAKQGADTKGAKSRAGKGAKTKRPPIDKSMIGDPTGFFHTTGESTAAATATPIASAASTASTADPIDQPLTKRKKDTLETAAREHMNLAVEKWKKAPADNKIKSDQGRQAIIELNKAKLSIYKGKANGLETAYKPYTAEEAAALLDNNVAKGGKNAPAQSAGIAGSAALPNAIWGDTAGAAKDATTELNEALKIWRTAPDANKDGKLSSTEGNEAIEKLIMAQVTLNIAENRGGSAYVERDNERLAAFLDSSLAATPNDANTPQLTVLQEALAGWTAEAQTKAKAAATAAPIAQPLTAEQQTLLQACTEDTNRALQAFQQPHTNPSPAASDEAKKALRDERVAAATPHLRQAINNLLRLQDGGVDSTLFTDSNCREILNILSSVAPENSPASAADLAAIVVKQLNQQINQVTMKLGILAQMENPSPEDDKALSDLHTKRLTYLSVRPQIEAALDKLSAANSPQAAASALDSSGAGNTTVAAQEPANVDPQAPASTVATAVADPSSSSQDGASTTTSAAAVTASTTTTTNSSVVASTAPTTTAQDVAGQAPAADSSGGPTPQNDRVSATVATDVAPTTSAAATSEPSGAHPSEAKGTPRHSLHEKYAEWQKKNQPQPNAAPHSLTPEELLETRITRLKRAIQGQSYRGTVSANSQEQLYNLQQELAALRAGRSAAPTSASENATLALHGASSAVNSPNGTTPVTEETAAATNMAAQASIAASTVSGPVLSSNAASATSAVAGANAADTPPDATAAPIVSAASLASTAADTTAPLKEENQATFLTASTAQKAKKSVSFPNENVITYEFDADAAIVSSDAIRAVLQTQGTDQSTALTTIEAQYSALPPALQKQANDLSALYLALKKITKQTNMPENLIAEYNRLIKDDYPHARSNEEMLTIIKATLIDTLKEAPSGDLGQAPKPLRSILQKPFSPETGAAASPVPAAAASSLPSASTNLFETTGRSSDLERLRFRQRALGGRRDQPEKRRLMSKLETVLEEDELAAANAAGTNLAAQGAAAAVPASSTTATAPTTTAANGAPQGPDANGANVPVDSANGTAASITTTVPNGATQTSTAAAPAPSTTTAANGANTPTTTASSTVTAVTTAAASANGPVPSETSVANAPTVPSPSTTTAANGAAEETAADPKLAPQAPAASTVSGPVLSSTAAADPNMAAQGAAANGANSGANSSVFVSPDANAAAASAVSPVAPARAAASTTTTGANVANTPTTTAAAPTSRDAENNVILEAVPTGNRLLNRLRGAFGVQVKTRLQQVGSINPTYEPNSEPSTLTEQDTKDGYIDVSPGEDLALSEQGRFSFATPLFAEDNDEKIVSSRQALAQINVLHDAAAGVAGPAASYENPMYGAADRKSDSTYDNHRTTATASAKPQAMFNPTYESASSFIKRDYAGGVKLSDSLHQRGDRFELTRAPEMLALFTALDDPDFGKKPGLFGKSDAMPVREFEQRFDALYPNALLSTTGLQNADRAFYQGVLEESIRHTVNDSGANATLAPLVNIALAMPEYRRTGMPSSEIEVLKAHDITYAGTISSNPAQLYSEVAQAIQEKIAGVIEGPRAYENPIYDTATATAKASARGPERELVNVDSVNDPTYEVVEEAILRENPAYEPLRRQDSTDMGNRPLPRVPDAARAAVANSQDKYAQPAVVSVDYSGVPGSSNSHSQMGTQYFDPTQVQHYSVNTQASNASAYQEPDLGRNDTYITVNTTNTAEPVYSKPYPDGRPAGTTRQPEAALYDMASATAERYESLGAGPVYDLASPGTRGYQPPPGSQAAYDDSAYEEMHYAEYDTTEGETTHNERDDGWIEVEPDSEATLRFKQSIRALNTEYVKLGEAAQQIGSTDPDSQQITELAEQIAAIRGKVESDDSLTEDETAIIQSARERLRTYQVATLEGAQRFRPTARQAAALNPSATVAPETDVPAVIPTAVVNRPATTLENSGATSSVPAQPVVPSQTAAQGPAPSASVLPTAVAEPHTNSAAAIPSTSTTAQPAAQPPAAKRRSLMAPLTAAWRSLFSRAPQDETNRHGPGFMNPVYVDTHVALPHTVEDASLLDDASSHEGSELSVGQSRTELPIFLASQEPGLSPSVVFRGPGNPSNAAKTKTSWFSSRNRGPRGSAETIPLLGRGNQPNRDDNDSLSSVEPDENSGSVRSNMLQRFKDTFLGYMPWRRGPYNVMNNDFNSTLISSSSTEGSAQSHWSIVSRSTIARDLSGSQISRGSVGSENSAWSQNSAATIIDQSEPRTLSRQSSTNSFQSDANEIEPPSVRGRTAAGATSARLPANSAQSRLYPSLDLTSTTISISQAPGGPATGGGSAARSANNSSSQPVAEPWRQTTSFSNRGSQESYDPNNSSVSSASQSPLSYNGYQPFDPSLDARTPRSKFSENPGPRPNGKTGQHTYSPERQISSRSPVQDMLSPYSELGNGFAVTGGAMPDGASGAQPGPYGEQPPSIPGGRGKVGYGRGSGQQPYSPLQQPQQPYGAYNGQPPFPPRAEQQAPAQGGYGSQQYPAQGYGQQPSQPPYYPQQPQPQPPYYPPQQQQPPYYPQQPQQQPAPSANRTKSEEAEKWRDRFAILTIACFLLGLIFPPFFLLAFAAAFMTGYKDMEKRNADAAVKAENSAQPQQQQQYQQQPQYQQGPAMPMRVTGPALSDYLQKQTEHEWRLKGTEGPNNKAWAIERGHLISEGYKGFHTERLVPIEKIGVSMQPRQGAMRDADNKLAAAFTDGRIQMAPPQERTSMDRSRIPEKESQKDFKTRVESNFSHLMPNPDPQQNSPVFWQTFYRTMTCAAVLEANSRMGPEALQDLQTRYDADMNTLKGLAKQQVEVNEGRAQGQERAPHLGQRGGNLASFIERSSVGSNASASSLGTLPPQSLPVKTQGKSGGLP